MKELNILDLKNEKSIALCIEYSDNKEQLQNVIDTLQISCSFVSFNKVEKDLLSTTINVKIVRNSREINFEYHLSHNDTIILQHDNSKEIYSINCRGINNPLRAFIVKPNNPYYKPLQSQKIKNGLIQEMINHLLYSILCSIKNDYYIPDYFEDFCQEFGYNEDSIKDNKLFNACRKQKQKLIKIFNEDDMECLPS